VKRTIGLFVSMISIAIASAGQTSQAPPVPPLQILGPQLVAWSQLQQPQPLPERTLLPSGPPIGQTTSHDTTPIRQNAVLRLKGSIAQSNGHYLLKLANDIAIQLDDPENSSRYEGKQVRIGGILEANGEKLHVISIELDS
jgi:hypothetical protein